MNWKLPKQTFLKENGDIGDCWRCCIAAILQLPAEEVPHFVKDTDSPSAETQHFLNAKGYLIVGSNRLDFPRLYSRREDFPQIPLIGVGPSPRSKGLGAYHAVVMIGEEIVYDPHPSEAGLTAIVDRYLIAKLL